MFCREERQFFAVSTFPPRRRQNERMSVNSVSTRLPPSYSPLTGNNSPTARSAVGAKGATEKSFARANDSQVTSGDPTDDEFRNTSAQTLEETLQQGAATARKSTEDSSESRSSRSSAGIALYQRVSQYGDYEPRASALLQRWNNIMEGGPAADSAAAAFAKTLSQHEMPGSESGVLDLTA